MSFKRKLMDELDKKPVDFKKMKKKLAGDSTRTAYSSLNKSLKV